MKTELLLTRNKSTLAVPTDHFMPGPRALRKLCTLLAEVK